MRPPESPAFFDLPSWMLQPEPVVALAVAAALLAGLLVALLLRRAQARQERDWLAAHAELDRDLAVERQRNLRIPELEGALHQREVLIEQLRGERGRAEQTLAAMRETLAQERRQADEKLALLTEARARMTQEFRVLADEVMRGHGREFGEQNRAQVAALLAPVRERIGEYQLALQAAATEATRERAALQEQVRALSEASAAMAGETVSLARALRGQAQMQGAWGEMVLATVLKHAGLREGEEYEVQATLLGEDGGRVRPDVLVNLPNGPRLAIDAKVSLRAFERHVNAEAETEAAEHLAAHVAALRAHVLGLGEKRYHAAVGDGLDYVIMFVPIEGALAAAVRAAPDLAALAAERHVAIATPTTLMIALRTVANVWQADRRRRNAEEIARQAGGLHDKFVGFLEDLGRIGKALDGARQSYEAAFAKLATGKGNLVRRVESLRELGARAEKAIPPDLLDGDGEDPRVAVSESR